MAWAEELSELRAAGFTDDEIAMEGSRLREEMTASGFNQKEVDDYFGIKEPDMAPVKQLIEKNMQAANQAQPKEARTFLETLEAGLQMSSGYAAVQALRGKSVTPDMLMPEDASTFYRIASQAATIAGDIPAMIAGAVIGAPAGGAAGGAVGSAVPVVGTAAGAAAGTLVGAGAGSNALPTAIREVLMHYYEKGEIQNFGDFWERTSSVIIDTAKSGVVGGVSMGVGGKVAGALTSRAVAPAATRIASTSAEISTMVAVGKGLEGEVPKAQDFMDAALLVGGMHVAIKAPTKLREIYAKTGVKPEDVWKEAEVNPVVKQELLNEADGMPKVYQEMAKANEAQVVAEAAKPDAPKTPQAEAVTPDAVTPDAITPDTKPAADTTPPSAQEKILSKVGEKAETPKKTYTRDDFYKDYVDRLDPIKKAVDELGADAVGLTAEGNPYKLARMANDHKAKVQHFFEKGTLDYATLEKTGKSFNEIVEPFKDDLGGLKAFLISKRALELEARGVKSGFDVAAATDVVKAGESKYATAAKELVDFQNSAVKYLKDSGVLSEKTFNNLVEAGQSYISFKRISEEGTVSKSGKGKPIHKIKGSDLNIQDPFISMIDNAETYLKLAERNRAVKSLVDLAEKSEGQTLIEKSGSTMKPIEISQSEIAKMFKEKGIDADAEALTVFRPDQRPLGPNEFEVWRDGKREVYKTEPALAEAIKTLDGNATAQNIVFKIARGITAAKRIGISLAPDFIVRNFFRDQLTAGTFAKGGTLPFWDTVLAMGDIVKKNDTYYNWLKAGGANGAFLELGERYINDNIYKLNAETKFIDRTWNLVTKPMHYLELAGSLAEQATRLAVSKKAMQGATSGPNVFEGGFASRESTIDFQRMGAKVAALNSITAFQNAQIQGLDRAVRAFKDNPGEVAMRAGMYITAPSILLWYANKDDERVKELPRWQKDHFWIIPTDKWVPESSPGEAANLPAHLVRVTEDGKTEINKGTIYRLPKPQELGILFGSIPERVLDAFFTDNPDAAADFGKTMMGVITPSMIPDAVAPIFEHYANKSFFTDGKLVPAHLEGIMPQYQYTDYTTETGKMLGKLVMAVPFIGDLGPKKTPLSSPMVLENYIRSWSGSMGMYALQLADKGLIAAGVTDAPPERPASTLADIPFVKAFVVRYPNGGTKSIQEFQEKFEENKMVLDTIKALSKRGSMDEAQAVMMAEENQSKLQDLSGIKEAISNQGQFIQMVYRNPDLSADEKRQIIDGAYYGMIESAKLGMQAVQEWEKSLKEQEKLLKEQEKNSGE